MNVFGIQCWKTQSSNVSTIWVKNSKPSLQLAQTIFGQSSVTLPAILKMNNYYGISKTVEIKHFIEYNAIGIVRRIHLKWNIQKKCIKCIQIRNIHTNVRKYQYRHTHNTLKHLTLIPYKLNGLMKAKQILLKGSWKTNEIVQNAR